LRTSNRPDAATLGKIILARFLALPLKSYERWVSRVETSAPFAALATRVEPGWIEGALLSHVDTLATTATTLGEVHQCAGRPTFHYDRPGFVREYRFDEEALRSLRQAGGLSAAQSNTLHRLRLINSRNRLTHALVATLLELQSGYLASGDRLALQALSQSEMSALLTQRQRLPLVADPGRLSRLIRVLSFRMSNGSTLPLGALFPSPRQLHAHRVDALIKKEQALMLNGALDLPFSDAALAEQLRQQYGVTPSRRTVVAIRHELAIPERRRRSERLGYLAATEQFSPLLPLTPQSLAAQVPPQAGVYEIRVPVGSEPGELQPDPQSPLSATERVAIVYIGSSSDLRKRLADHLRGSSGNLALAGYLASGMAKIRYRVVPHDWRAFERGLYRAYCASFGAPPPAIG